LVEKGGELGQLRAQLTGHSAPLEPRGVGIVLRKGVAMKAETTRLPLLPAWARALRMKWTRQRCQLARIATCT